MAVQLEARLGPSVNDPGSFFGYLSHPGDGGRFGEVAGFRKAEPAVGCLIYHAMKLYPRHAIELELRLVDDRGIATKRAIRIGIERPAGASR